MPFFTATADGLFARHGLQVDIRPPIGGPDNVRSVATGGADFCVTSVHHYLTAVQRFGSLAARFVGIVVQRSPVAALVAEDSAISTPADLAGVRFGASEDDPHTAELLLALDTCGVRRPDLVNVRRGDQWAALGDGTVEATTEYVDGLPRASRLAGRRLRAVPVGTAIYSSGVVAADRVPLETAHRLRTAIGQALTHQREHPMAGLAELCAAHPGTVPDEAIEGWRLLEPFVFANGIPPGSMDRDRWAATVEQLCTARGLPALPAETLYRPELTDSHELA